MGKPEGRPKARRFAIPPNKRHRNRKTDYVRQPKHKGKEE